MTDTIKQSLDRANPNTLADILRALKFGNVMRWQPTAVARSSSAASASVAAAAFTLSDQAEDARAVAVLGAYARAGAGALGALAVAAFPPAAGRVAVAPNGSIALNAVDAYTDLDVHYVPAQGEVVELDGNVTANVFTLPVNVTTPGVILAIEVEALTGGATGQKVVLIPGAGAPAAGECRLNLAKTTVTFAVADAVTTARARLLVVPSVDVNELLGSDSAFI